MQSFSCGQRRLWSDCGDAFGAHVIRCVFPHRGSKILMHWKSAFRVNTQSVELTCIDVLSLVTRQYVCQTWDVYILKLLVYDAVETRIWAATRENIPSRALNEDINTLRICTVWSESSLSAWSYFPLHSWLSKMRAVKILISLCECTGWSESSLGAHVLWRCDTF